MKRTLLLITIFILSTVLFSQTRLNITAYQADSIATANFSNSNFKILDVRTASEFSTGHLENALNIDYYTSTFSQQIRELDKNNIYLVHCQGGSRSAKAMDSLQVLAFKETYNLIGGISAWKSAGYKVVTTTTYLSEQIAKIEISPNPASNYLTINIADSSNSTLQVLIYNTLGKLQKVVWVTQFNQKIDIEDLKNGIYFIHIKAGDKEFKSKIIVRK